ncbi:MAG: CPBP family intramembrane metalloprotease [Clostridia bacterium]|nr:CPBP family intramembrane metalloprotease [Clostridia bacterium]
MQKNKVEGGYSGPPALVLVISVLMIALMFLDLGAAPGHISAYVLVIALHAVIFGIPSVLYLVLRGKSFSRSIKKGIIPRSAAGVVILGTLLLILQSCILKFGVFYFGYDYSAYTLYGSSFQVSASGVGEWILMVLALAIVPAVTEEIVFRGIIFTDYRKCGFWCAATATSLLFAFIHFDFPQFLIYFLDGLLLAWIMFISGTLLAPVIAHIIYNVFVLFLEKYIWLFSSNPDSEILFWLLLIALYLFILFLFIGVAEGHLRKLAEEEEFAPEKVSRDKLLGTFFRVFTAKPMLLEYAVFTVVAIISAL